MTASPQRCLIVNADDLGFTSGVNRGIIEAHENGIVTSSTLMVRGAAADEAAALCREHPRLDVGLHVDLAEWIYRNDEWVCLYEVVPVKDPQKVAQEVDNQLAAFRRLMGKDPTHIDSHQHVHRDEPLKSILVRAAAAMQISLRHFSRHVQYSGLFYGQDGKGRDYSQAIQVPALLKILENLPPRITELGCHPGYPEGLDSVYRTERLIEVQTLSDPRVKEAVARLNIQLQTFAAVH